MLYYAGLAAYHNFMLAQMLCQDKNAFPAAVSDCIARYGARCGEGSKQFRSKKY